MTDFFASHPMEIQQALIPKLSWELLQMHAVEKLACDARMTDQECQAHGFPGKVQYYDAASKGWVSVDVPRVRWFDGRELTRETVTQTKD